MMMITKKDLRAVAMASLVFAAGCTKDGENAVDTAYPEIDISYAAAFPKQCSSVKRGTTIRFEARFKDNVALGGYSLDVHHNFDQHTHSTEVNSCTPAPVKTPVQPFLFIKSYTIPDGQREFVAHAEIQVPTNVDPGDYHFMIRLTDKEGWQTLRGLSIKIN